MRLLVQPADGRSKCFRSLDVVPSSTLADLLSQVFPRNPCSPRTCGACHPSSVNPVSTLFTLRLNRRLVSVTNPGLLLSQLGFQDGDEVAFTARLRGGGGDGGSTCAESRSCYLEMYAQRKPDRVDPKDTLTARWTSCSLSAEPLTPPCVIDKLGNVLNKEAVVRSLVTKTMPAALRHIRGLKDVIDIHLAEIPSVSPSAIVRFQCPISGQEFSGSSRFVALSVCGHVVGVKALKELKAQACPVCHAAYQPHHSIPINGTEEEVEALRTRMDQERAKAKAERKNGGSAGKQQQEGGQQEAQEGLARGANGGKPEGVLSGTSGGEDRGTGAERHPGPRQEKKGMEVKKVGGLLKAKGGAPGAAAPAAVSSSHSNGKGEKRTSESAVGKGGGKKFKAVEHAPAGASTEVYASIFTSSRTEEFQETYSCRSLPLARN